MSSFPYKKTEKAIQEFTQNSQDKTRYRSLLRTFIEEYSIDAVYGPDTLERVLDYLTDESSLNRFTWYYTLSHQIVYFSKYRQFDLTDLNYLTLTDIIEHPSEYINVHEETVFPR